MSEVNGGDSRSVVVHGTCALARAEIDAALAGDDVRRILDARGDFVVVSARGPAGDIVVTSRSGIVNYFHAAGPAGVAHGPDVATVAERAGLPWQWDHEAVADYLRFGHPLGDATVHARVRRFPAGVAVRVDASGCSPAFAVGGAHRDGPCGRATVDLVVDALLNATGSTGADLTVSMSGGLDSRLLLAALLSARRRPHLVVSGVPGSFDRDVTAAIASRYRLPLMTVTVTAESVRAGAVETVRAANGLLPATNWAGLEHLRTGRAAVYGPVLLGYNGEFARSYYAPARGLAAGRLAALHRHRAVDLLDRRFAAPFGPAEMGWLAPDLRVALSPGATRARLAAVMDDLPGDSAMDVADEFFLSSFGQQKTGANLAALGRYVRWSTPLFDPAWTDAVRRLPRRWKLGSRLHRHVIATLCPGLLDFPEEGFRGRSTSRRPPWRYWAAGPRRSRTPPYLAQSMFRGGPVFDMFDRYHDQFADLVTPALSSRLAAEQPAGSWRPHVAYALLSLAALRAAVDPTAVRSVQIP